MKKRGLHKNKSAQFYLLAAIVLVAIIIGLAGVMNYSKKKSDTKLIDLGEELGIEGSKVLEHGVYNPDTDLINDFTEKYNDYAGQQERELYYIFGDSTEVVMLTYQQIDVGKISFGGVNYQTTQEGLIRYTIPNPSNPIELKIGDSTYSFDLNPGENFYFVISQELTSGEEHVVQG